MRVLAQLHNSGQTLGELAIDSITKFVSVEKDTAYMVAQEKEQIKFVTNLLADSDFSPERIAKIAGVSVEFVRKIQHKLTSN